MDDLIAFLKARLDEDELAARDAGAEAWRKAERPSIWVERAGGPVAQTKDFEDAAHIVRHDPARVLREVEAKRQLLDRHKSGRYGECVTCDVGAQSCGCCGWGDFPCDTVRLLALPYSDHPDYREEWKP